MANPVLSYFTRGAGGGGCTLTSIFVSHARTTEALGNSEAKVSGNPPESTVVRDLAHYVQVFFESYNFTTPRTYIGFGDLALR